MAEYKTKSNFYAGADYGLDSNYGKGDTFLGFESEYRFPVSQFGLTTDPRTSNQLKAVSDKLSTGAKTIEVTGITSEVFESIPDQHLDEINRLRKLTGIDITFHGPLIEPTGVKSQGWDPSHREQAERQMFQSVQRAQKMDNKGNVVITFHSSNGLPSPISKEYDEKTGKEVIKEFWVVDEKNGQFKNLSPEINYMEGQKEYPSDPYQKIQKENKDAWFKALQQVNFHANQGARIVESVLSKQKEEPEKEAEGDKKALLHLYKKYGTPEAEDVIKKAGDYGAKLKYQMDELVHGDLYLRDSYNDLRNLFNQAYETAEINSSKEDIKKLDRFAEKMKPKVKSIEDPTKLDEMAHLITEGINVLRSIDAPQTLKPLRNFAIDKASETFSNVALKSYKEFKEHSPIISIENPPVGMGLSRADELRDLVKASREKFIKKAVEQGISHSTAEEQSKKLIGATWDVGHINMLRKYGYDTDKITKETAQIAPFVKHIHLSDNFGMEHTELPMGMGNVPTKKHMELIAEYNQKAKKIIETGGNWFQFFQKSPLAETLRAFGSPVYGMSMGPYWNQSSQQTGGYFAGYGAILPDVHFATYGAGFSGLPTELGGQIGGGRNRLSGTPMD